MVTSIRAAVQWSQGAALVTKVTAFRIVSLLAGAAQTYEINAWCAYCDKCRAAHAFGLKKRQLFLLVQNNFKTGFPESRKIGPHSALVLPRCLAAGQGVALILLQTVAVQKASRRTATLSKCKRSAALQWQRLR
tara:strand:- start:169 stop:570 length:402 start_codon:yes stop_codon:yes gene_type:complete